MAYAPIAFIAPNYRDFKNEWLKAYIPGATTPKPMALESNGGTQVSKLQLNADGFIVSAGGALVIPYIDGAYDLWLFPTEAEADANNTSNAIRVADDITSVGGTSISIDIINDLSQAFEFDTVADFKTSTITFPANKTIKTRGNIIQGLGAGTYIFKTFAQATIDGDIYSPSTKRNIEGVNGVIVLQLVSGRYSASQIGVNGTFNANDSINEFASLPMNIDVDCYFTDVTIPVTMNFIGTGSFVGINAAGTKPTFTTLEATATPAERLALQQTYISNTVNLTGAGQFSGVAIFTNALFVGDGDTEKTIFCKGRMSANNCATHKVGLTAFVTGAYEAANLSSTDAPSDGVLLTGGGKFSGSTCLIYKAVRRGIYINQGGTFVSDQGEVYRSQDIGAFVNGGGTIDLNNGKCNYNEKTNIAANYVGSIRLGAGEATHSVGGAGVAIESNCTIFAEGATVTDNALWALTTSYGGFIQARSAIIQRNGVAANLPAVTTLTGGNINIQQALVDNSNSGTSPVIVSRDDGYITSEPAGSGNKSTLTTDDYNPPWGVIGNGKALIYDNETVFTPYPDDKVGLNDSQKLTSRRQTGIVTVNSVSTQASWINIDNSLGPIVIDDIQLAAFFICDEVVIQPITSNFTVTIQQGGGNVRLDAPKVLNGSNNFARFNKLEFVNRWTSAV